MSRFTLPKKHLLRTTREFQRVYRLGRRVRGDGFAIIFTPNAEKCNRLGISVHRKAGNAVQRNRIKRLIREVFRLNRDLFPPCCDIVFTIRPGFALNSLVGIQTDVSRIICSSGQVGGKIFEQQ